MKNGQSNARSSSSSSVPAISAGNAKITISAATSTAQANSGILISVMPGARVNRMPMISSIAPAIAEISMKPMPSSHQSAPMPGECSLPVNGGYMNQPPSGEAPKKMVMKNASPPIA